MTNLDLNDKKLRTLASTHPELVMQWSPRNLNKPDYYKPKSGKKVWWVCSEGHEWEAKIYSRSEGSGCPYCSGRLTLAGFNDLRSLSPGLMPEWNYTKNKNDPEMFSNKSGKKVWWVCAEGHEWEAVIANRVNFGYGCPICSGQSALSGFNDLATTHPELLQDWDENFEGPSPHDVVSMSNKVIGWKCALGHTWNTPVYFRTIGMRDTGCPKCCPTHTSSAERSLLEFIESIYSGSINNSCRDLIPPREVDIYLPDLKIAIEFNGVFWHSSKFQQDKLYHYKKWKECHDLGIQLITIWEDEWRFKPEIVKSMLRHKLGQNASRKVFARKTDVAYITYQEASKLLEENHIQGKASGTYYLGLKTKDSGELVAVMVLKRTKDTLTLDRYATSVNVVGGQSKLLSFVDKNINYIELITFADLSVSDGNLYEKTGWVRDGLLPPDYRYVVNGRREHKFNYRLAKFKKNPALQYVEGYSESRLAKLNNIHRIYDCGKIRYKRVNPNI